MLWNAAYFDCLINTSLVCLGSAFWAVLIGLMLAVLTSWCRIPFRRTLTFCMLSMVLLPVYVQATAWSAGFGVQGWLRISQVSAALSPWRAIASVAWIHGTSNGPICFLLCVMGIRRSLGTDTRQALLDFGALQAFRIALLPALWPWIAAGGLWTLAVTGNDMVVTNLFQVPTITESVYQQVQFQQLRSGFVLTASSFAILISSFTFLGFLVFANRFGSEGNEEVVSTSALPFQQETIQRWIGFLIGLSIVLVTVLLPMANLVIKSGWMSRMEGTAIQRSWSFASMAQAVYQTPTQFATEFRWSLELSTISASLAVFIAIAMVRFGNGRWWNGAKFGAMGGLLAMPGPLVNLAVIGLLDQSDLRWIQDLADRSLIGPVIALQSRCLPIAFAILFIANHRFENRNRYELLMGRGLPWRTQAWVRWRGMRGPIVLAWTIGFFVAFADLASYLLVQPPGVTTVAMRMFELLHYGVRNQEAGLALVLALLGMVVSIFVLRQLNPSESA